MAVRLSENNRKELEKYQCPRCDYVLRDPVQQMCCGHWLCECCAKELAEAVSPRCPRVDCMKPWNKEEEPPYFPDRFVRKSLSKLSVKCSNAECSWIGTVDSLNRHQAVCSYTKTRCLGCQEWLSADEVKTHKSVCVKAMTMCCFSELGCDHKAKMTREQLVSHLTDRNQLAKHLEIIAKHLKLSDQNLPALRVKIASILGEHAQIEMTPKISGILAFHQLDDDENTQMWEPLLPTESTGGLHTASFSNDIDEKIKAVLETKPQCKLNISEGEDHNFRRSFIWKIAQFSQRMEDARSGKYTFIVSQPFYSGQYGYKMCLCLYILGDGIGMGTHMSLFLVIMKGEYDAILQWPFTHKVSFHLINQHHGRDIVDVFQPDPLSSSFQRPKTDMNVASGCPRFVSLAELNQGGFIEDNTIFIKAMVDVSTIKHP